MTTHRNPPQDAHAPQSYQPLVDISVLTLVALLLNLFRIGNTSIVLDESSSVKLASMDLVPLVEGFMGSHPNMILYHLILTAWVRAFGQSETAIRSLSAIFGALAVCSIYLLGLRLYGRSTAILAALLLALDSFMVQYAQLARSY